MDPKIMSVMVILALLILTSAARAASYTFQSFDEPNAFVYPGYEGTQPRGINDKGQVSGYYRDSPGYHHGFIRSSDGTTYTSFDCTSSVCNGSGWSYGAGINTSGVAVGYCLGTSLGYHRGFMRSAGGAYTAVEDPLVQRTYQDDGTTVSGINDKGQMVGYYTVTTGGHGVHGFFTKTDGTFVNVDYPSINWTLALGINSGGDVTGYYSGGYCGYAAFYMTAVDGTYHNFEVPNAYGSGCTSPMGINDSRQIVGYFRGADNKDHGFVRSADGMQYSTLDYPSATLTRATAINNSGQVTGYYQDSLGMHGFIATPIPIQPVMIVGPPVSYSPTLIAAYLTLQSVSTVTMKAQDNPEFDGVFNLNKNVSLTLIGGYDSNFDEPPAGMTYIQGELIVGSGSLIAANLVID
ncbi:MAG: hypothetical protein HXX11_18230 [Desulfuromonadales bacterium]|nr:hypothetical protein [Desulfuromonadales bacterium]